MRFSQALKLAPALLSLILGIDLTRPAWSADNRWSPFGPGSRRIVSLALAPGEPATLYAAVDQDGDPTVADGALFRSRDGGISWAWWGLYLDYGVERVAVDALESRTLAMANLFGDVFSSHDGGGTWSKVRQRSPNAFYDRTLSLMTLGGTLYLGGNTGLLRSRDGGQTWSQVFDRAPVLALAAHAAAPETLYLGSPQGVWQSRDGGDTWNPTLRPAGHSFTILAIASADPKKVYAASRQTLFSSADGGRTWQRQGHLENAASLAVDAGWPNQLYAVQPDGLSVSTDGGRTWNLTFPRPGNTLAIDPGRPGTVYAGTQRDGLILSQNGGLSWHTPAQRGLGGPDTTLLEADPRHPSTLYLCQIGGDGPYCLQSSDSGRRWTALRNHLARKQPLLRDLAFDPAEPDVVYGAGTGFYRIEDRGSHWVRLSLDFRNSDFTVIETLPGHAILAGGVGGFRSTDRGDTWKTVLPPLLADGTTRNVQKLIRDPLDPSTVYARAWEYRTGTTDRMITYRSRDGGQTWTPILSDSLVLVPSPSTHGLIYAGLRKGTVMRSLDWGTTWEALSTIPSILLIDLALDPKRPAILLAATFGAGVQLSRDAGRTWSPFNAGLTRQGIDRITKILSDPATPGRFWILPVDGGVFEATVK